MDRQLTPHRPTRRASTLGTVFTAQGPGIREPAVQALSGVGHGYDLLAPTFDHTPFRTSDAMPDAVGRALRALGPFSSGLDLWSLR